MPDVRLKALLELGLQGTGGITILTGAGISAESNIPTFRGPEGYWTVGSQVYQPQEMATYRMFQQNPKAVWQWYLYRLGVCQAAQPNSGHLALVELEALLPGRFTLITQNVDNLHLRAGQNAQRTFEIHGNIFFARCTQACRQGLLPVPAGLAHLSKESCLSETQWKLLRCKACGGWLRPHVLWFDETYNEAYYRYTSSLEVARVTDLLLIVGTSGATNLPNQVVTEVHHKGGVIIDINPESNPFGRLAQGYPNGLTLRQPSGTALPMIVKCIKMLNGAE